jgi:hypothetical protein
MDSRSPVPLARRARGVLAAVVLAVACLAGGQARAAGALDASGHFRIGSVVVLIDGRAAQTQDERKLESDVRRALGVFPGRSYEQTEIELALKRLRSSGIPASAQGYVFDEDGSIGLVVVVEPRPAADTPPSWTDGLRLVDDGSRLLKVRLGLKGAVAASGNQWFDNGETLTEFNPRGRFTGGRGPNGVVDLAPSVGLAGAIPLSDRVDAAYLYASTLYLGALSVGQDNNRNDLRTGGGWEEAYAGVVDAGTTAAGLAWRANLSYGRQKYCIGGGMLLCQIASSGGDRAVDFAWPRWSGNDFLKAQLRLNQTLFEAFSFEPNDFPSTKTRLSGINADHDNGNGVTLGFTWLTAEEGELQYFFPDGSSQVRDGLRVWHARGGWRPTGGNAGPVAKLEYARQTHADFDMRATGLSAEGGWQFGDIGWRPSVTYRYSATTGDDPATERYERWDLLYSGGDIDSWVQGQLMKNIHYNSNVRVHRLLARATPQPRWRLTGAVSTFRADTLNNIGGVISTLAGHDIGDELLLVAENFASSQVYWRFTVASLWPGPGVTSTLPEKVAKPWFVGIVQFNLAF